MTDQPLYQPSTPPSGSADAQWMFDELLRLARALTEQTAVELRPRTTEPDRPREGMLVFADGTHWNPGSGKGTYEYKGGAWVPLF